MGELANEARRLLDDTDTVKSAEWDEWRACADETIDRIAALEQRVAELEQWQDAQFTGAPLVKGRDYIRYRGEVPVIIGDDITSVGTLRTRLIAAERRADSLLAALNEIVLCEGEMLELHAIPANADHRVAIGGTVAHWHAINRTTPLLVAVIGPRTPSNPDLLERRGTELIEAGERLLREYQERASTNPSPPAATKGG